MSFFAYLQTVLAKSGEQFVLRTWCGPDHQKMALGEWASAFKSIHI